LASTGAVTDTQWSTATAQQLLSRYGIVTREIAGAEGLTGGFGAVYDVLKAMEDAGRVRRGYFVGNVAATQFALPAALELLRSLRDTPDQPEVIVMAATDPANPYGVTLKWPEAATDSDGAGRGPTRTVGALVVLVNGMLAAYLPRGLREMTAFLPEDEPARSAVGRALGEALANLARDRGLLVAEINGRDPADHPLTPYLIEAGFHASAMGLQMVRPPSLAASQPVSAGLGPAGQGPRRSRA
jgi:ATP-dependent Lhr-like helicase